MTTEQVFYYLLGPARIPQAIDIAVPDATGELVGQISGESKSAIAARYACEVHVANMDEYLNRKEQMLTGKPEPIAQEAYTRALECLPPNDWIRRGGWETFKMCEHFSGRITSIYAQGPDGCFSFHGLCTLTHEEIVRQCAATASAQRTAAGQPN